MVAEDMTAEWPCLAFLCRDDTVLLLNPALGDRLLVGSTDQLLDAFTPPEEPALQPAQWLEASEEERERGLRLRISHSKVYWGEEGGRCSLVPLSSLYCFLTASDTSDLAQAWGLLGRSAGHRRPHPGADPPAESAS